MSYGLGDWAQAKGEDYALTEEQALELNELLAPAVTKCMELNIPFVFAYQSALENNGIQTGLSGLANGATPERASPNILLLNLLFGAADLQPHESLAHVSHAVQERLDRAQEEKGPQIIL